MGQKGPKAMPTPSLFKMKYQGKGGAEALLKSLTSGQEKMIQSMRDSGKTEQANAIEKGIKNAPAKSYGSKDKALRALGSKDKTLMQEGPNDPKNPRKKVVVQYIPEDGSDPYDIEITEGAPLHELAKQQAIENFGDASGKLSVPGGIDQRGYTADTDPRAAGLTELQVAERQLQDVKKRPEKYGSKSNSQAYMNNLINKINRLKKSRGK